MPARVVAARVLVDGDARWPPVGLGSAVLVIDGGESRSAVFDADLARRERLAAPGVRVAVGVPVPPTQASESLRTAELLQARLDVEGWPGATPTTLALPRPTSMPASCWQATTCWR